jgi:hypothetical protein
VLQEDARSLAESSQVSRRGVPDLSRRVLRSLAEPSEVSLRHGGRLWAVRASEEGCVDQERVELVEGQQRAPVTWQMGRRRPVRVEDVVQVRGAEEAEHGEVGDPVTAVGGGVDELLGVERASRGAGVQRHGFRADPAVA